MAVRLQGALDSDIHTIVQKFLSDGVAPTTGDLYNALSRSNSALKRRPKKNLLASIERVLEFIGATAEDDGVDSDTIIEDAIPEDDQTDLMNRSLRQNLAPQRPASPPQQLSDEALGKRRKANGEALPKRQKRGNVEEQPKPSISAPTDISLDDVGGMTDTILQLNKTLLAPMSFYKEFREAHVPLPKGIMLHGPPGCGKTMLVRAFAAEMGVPFIEILGPAIVSGMSGESEKGIRDRFEEAKKNAPCLIFIDEIDAIAPKRDSSQSQMEKRIVAQLLVSMDELNRDSEKPVVVLAATNRPDSIDPALRRGGRFGTEINIGVPNEATRQRILETQTRNMPKSNVDFQKLAKLTAGFVGADLHDLVGKAGAHTMERLMTAFQQQVDQLALSYTPSDRFEITQARRIAARGRASEEVPRPPGFELISLHMEDFLHVLPSITPSSKREGFTTVPNVSWKDIGALQPVREELIRSIVDPIAKPALYEAFGINAPSGVLLWGPPGCGKTLLAKAAAAESQANFISIKGPELLNKFVGESEAAVRKVFQRARSSVPCVIFFDELDALVPKRDTEGSEASARVVNTLLTELDGLDIRAGIYIIAATNRPDMIDEAMLRPGRLGTQLFVDLPGAEERVDILRALTRGKPCTFSEQIQEVARGCENFSGADLGALLQQAVQSAIRSGRVRLDYEDFVVAKARTRASVREKDAERYRNKQKDFGLR